MSLQASSAKSPPDWAAVLFLAVLGLAAHGVILATDQVLWDSHWYIPELAGAGTKGMLRLFHEIGRPMDYWFLAMFAGHVSAGLVKVLSVAAWTLGFCAAFLVLERGAFLPRPLAWAACAVGIVFPAFDVLGQIALWPNVAELALFWGGWLLFVVLPGLKGTRFWVARLAALLLLGMSMNLNSLLVFYYGLALFLLLSRFCSVGCTSRATYAIALCRRFPDFAAVPVLFWVAKSLLTPVSGYYRDYNQPTLAPSRILKGIYDMCRGYLVPEAVDMFGSPLPVVVALVAGAAFVILLARLRLVARNSPRDSAADRRSALVMAAGGLMLLFAAALPYFAVDQALSSDGWLSRNCILTPLPIGMLIAGAFYLFNSLLAPHRRGLWTGPVAATVVAAIIASNAGYLRLQAQGVKEQSIARKLALLIRERGACVVQLRDYYDLPGTIPYYPPLIWTFIASEDKGEPSAFVIETAHTIPHEVRRDPSGQPSLVMPVLPITPPTLRALAEQTTMPYMLNSIPPGGPQVMLVVREGHSGSDALAMGARYLWTKWFEPETLGAFVDGVTETSAMDLPPVAMTAGDASPER